MERTQTGGRRSFLDRPLQSVVRITPQTVILALIVLVLVFTRLYDLGNRSYCHDESTHAWEPWKLITGQGYRFDPVYHGPFLYHATAFFFFLFGDTDTTARLPAALMAVLAVLLVWPLRRWLGRAGTLFAMLLLTLSPTMMFRGRFIRHDIFVIVPTMAMVIGFFNYLTDRKQKWLYLIAAGLALSFCAKANAFINGAIFGSFLAGYLLIEWWRTRQPLRDMPAFDLVALLATLALPLVSSLILKVFGYDPLDYSPAGLLRIRIVILVTLAVSAVLGILWKRREWPIAAGIYYGIFVPLYTTMFTNGTGLEAGFVGMLGYWLSQQGVRRGSQPWYYFTFLNVVYEFLPLLMAVLAIVYYLWRTARPEAQSASRKRGTKPEEAASGEEAGTAHQGLPFVGFLVYWTATNFLFWTWASEKMPWQNQHLVLTFGLLGGWFLGRVWERTDWRKLMQRGAGYALILLPLALFTLVVLVNTTRGTPRPFGGMDLDQLAVTLRWLLSLILLMIAAALIYSLARRLGWGGWVRVMLAALFVVLLVVTVRVAIMLSFKNQDYATEFLVYAASTPDTAALMRELDDMARYLPDGQPLRIAYDNDSQQPFFWYLRKLDNVTFFTGAGGLSGDQDVVIIGLDNESKMKAQFAGKYVKRNYRLIWWPNEDVYRNLTLGKLWSDLRDPARRKYWWDILWWRKYPESTVQWPSVHRFSLYVRKDLAAKVWNLGPEVAITGVELPEDEYEKKRVDVAAIASFGTAGSSNGQFNDPKNLAVDAQGQVYVIDTRNHRVQVFGADGQFLRMWGSQGNGPGQFQEPWGIAVDKAGNVYVADTWNHRIQKFDNQGQFLTMWGTFGDTGGALGASDTFYGPRQIVVDRDGNLLVSDTGNKRILKFGPDGQFIEQLGGGGSLSGEFSEPCGLAVDADGDIYVADVWNQRVQKFDAQFNFLTQWPVLGWESQLPANKPYIAVDGKGDVYVTAPDYNRVCKFDGQGKLLAVWGQFGTDASSFNVPSGIAVDSTGDVYVTDSGNNRVLKFPPVN
jgi:uncharacterized protein (TIGR03663 family)